MVIVRVFSSLPTTPLSVPLSPPPPHRNQPSRRVNHATAAETELHCWHKSRLGIVMCSMSEGDPVTARYGDERALCGRECASTAGS